MNLSRPLLQKATQKGIITSQQEDSLWHFLQNEISDIPSFQLTHLLYYFGGFIAIAAMSLFIILGHDRFGGFWISTIAVIYMLLGLVLTYYLNRRRLIIPSGITATFVTALTPLAIYGLQMGLGWWPENFLGVGHSRMINGLWIMMEFGTLIVGTTIFYFYNRPFLLLPIAATLWYMSIDVTMFFLSNSWELKQVVSMVIGGMMILSAFFIDLHSKSKKDYAFHLYLFGLFAFWSALSSLQSDNELSKFFYFLINLILILIGCILARRIFVIFGGTGTILYIGHLSYSTFKDSMLFPFILSLIGFLTIYIGILWTNRGERWNYKIQSYLPKSLKNLIKRRY